MSLSVDHVIETFHCAGEENQVDPYRHQQTVYLPEEGELWMTGDIHDHRHNFASLLEAADLANNPQRHLVLHELIHGDHYDSSGAEESWKMLFRAAELKCDFPDQVHFLLSNHDLAQIHGEGILKAGQSVCEAFNMGVEKAFGMQGAVVNVAISEFLLTFPLAVRSPNGLFCCHSLPTDQQVEKFDYTVFVRSLTGKDYARRTGPVYQLIWGRGFSPNAVDLFADHVQASIILTGHQPQEGGYKINGSRNLILASDHNRGVYLPVDLSTPYTMPELVKRLTRFIDYD